jgi:predicted membrane channel-forming protein YqfA (hemolysin III family)
LSPAVGTPWSATYRASFLAATFAFSLVALTMLAHVAAASSTDRQRAVAILVYGATLATSALCSFLYHGLAQARGHPLLR